MKKLGYAGITAAGFLTTIASVAAGAGLIGLIVNYLEEWIVLYMIGPLIICAAAGMVHRAFRRVIRRKLHMKTTVYSLVCHGVPILCGIVGVVLGAGEYLEPEPRAYTFIAGIVMFVAGSLGGLFATALDRFFDGGPEVKKTNSDRRGTNE